MATFPDLTPALSQGDVIDAEESVVTDLGNAVTFTRDSGGVISGFTGTFSGNAIERFLIKIFDASEGDWHVESGEAGIYVYVQTGVYLSTLESGTARATRAGYFAGKFVPKGATVTLTSPFQFSPYWMEAVGSFPTTWAPFVETFNASLDLSILRPLTPTDVAEVLALANGPVFPV